MFDFVSRLKDAAPGKTHLFSVGQAGFVIKTKSGKTLAIDPYLSDCVLSVEGNDGFKRMLPPILGPEEYAFDYLITTHFHRDHFDVDAVPGLMRNGHTRLYAAYDCREDVQRLGIDPDRTLYAQAGDVCQAGEDFRLYFISCDHGTQAPQAFGVIVVADEKIFVFTGDTALHTEWAPEYLKCGVPDVLVAPINGKAGNLSEEECAVLAQTLQPKLTVPCHYGMFPGAGGVPGLFRELMIQKHLNYNILTYGEDLVTV